MKKTELIATLAKQLDMPQHKVKSVLEGLVEELCHQLEQGNTVKIAGLGDFSCKTHAKRKAQHPTTKETIHIPAKVHPSFSPSSTLKKRLNPN